MYILPAIEFVFPARLTGKLEKARKSALEKYRKKQKQSTYYNKDSKKHITQRQH
ncbi:hypothetical protein M083_1781 [Bacteroides fragilis str. 3986 T(B)9]|nr:hypothetical protein M111_1543 [Bacteroides fragilis str. 3986T(B)10]EXY70551.1 hypothetical protein M083_1781 [Bacteroides fragilis str. 3986 T(B)9]EYA52540.1 hypothetical protein M114_1582 [Bacteroides fragilis str. 3986 N(B)22]EYA57239.1 hypothetical protein M112_1780 [Bacteroides fragilis str. 3986 T(B)13]EYE67926.1 hypothetical protein M113_1773 [Bacteroides fragilis str. 3986 N3]KXU45613.1 hypothetical protein HMPREF2530_02396 [Bacteroides fragilis]